MSIILQYLWPLMIATKNLSYNPTVEGLVILSWAPKVTIGLPARIIGDTENFTIWLDCLLCSETARAAFVTL